ncbi:MAG TPA: DinB family protein [Pyrinomonadaceae bacterium]|nr:DinB family protein [Pyrinomonadaceae bacterium]
MENDAELRRHVLELLDGSFAHIGLETATRGFPMNLINERLEGSPHSPWHLLEHLRLAQWDIVEFSRDPDHVSPDFPDGYWNLGTASVNEWERSVEQILGDLQTMRDMIADPSSDLFAPFPHGDGQTLLREALLIADHNSYHLGQIIQLKKTLEAQN